MPCHINEPRKTRACYRHLTIGFVLVFKWRRIKYANDFTSVLISKKNVFLMLLRALWLLITAEYHFCSVPGSIMDNNRLDNKLMDESTWVTPTCSEALRYRCLVGPGSVLFHR